METIVDLFDPDDLNYSDDIIELNKNENYYIGKAEFALKQLDGYYFIYLGFFYRPISVYCGRRIA